MMIITLRRRPRSDKWRKYAPYLILPVLLAVDFNELVIGFPIGTIGVSFSIIRVFMTTKQSLGSRKGAEICDISSVVVAAFYLPALPVGPVFSGLDLQKSRPTLSNVETVRHLRLIFTGLVLVSLLAPAIGLRALSIYDGALQSVVIAPTMLFVQLFFAFWGQSLIAENFAPLFGHKIPVNFKEPWLARDIRDFWQRWHRSIANFVMTYIFLPLQVNGVPPKIATIAAFVFMGLWHNISVGYFIWGLGHGVLLAYWPKFENPRFPAATAVAQRVALFSFVIGLSYVANYADLGAYL